MAAVPILMMTEMRMPASYGAGVAFRYNDQFTLAADVSVIEWNRFQLTMADGSRISPVNGLPMNISDIDPTVLEALATIEALIEARPVQLPEAGF